MPRAQAAGWACPTCGKREKQYAPSGRCLYCEGAVEGVPEGSDTDAGPPYQIGEVAERAGLSLRTVRYYEEAGLVLPAGRTAGGFRLYSDAALERLAVIKHMKPLGFSLEEMRALLEVRDELERDDLDPQARAHLRGRLEMFTAAAQERYVALQEQLRIAQSFLHRLHQDVARHQ